MRSELTPFATPPPPTAAVCIPASEGQLETAPYPRSSQNFPLATAGKKTHARKTHIPGLTEAEAIERAKAGDEASFEALYLLHKRHVYSLCLRMTRSITQAEDLTQEAFLQLYCKIGSFRGESAFSTWLHRISVNIVLMSLRKRSLPEVSLDESLEPREDDGPTRELAINDRSLVGSIDRINLERAIDRLAPGYRIIFLLHDVEGYEHKEIAEMRACSIGNSKSQLHKARLKMQSLLPTVHGDKALPGRKKEAYPETDAETNAA